MFLRPKSLKITLIITAFCLANTCASYAAEDGFGPSKRVEGKHFIVYYTPIIEIEDITQQLSINYTDKLLAGNLSKKDQPYYNELARMIDTLFIKICDILDMPLYSFQGNIKICKDFSQLKQIYFNLFAKEMANSPSFYVDDLNTIYITQDSFKKEILGHEIAHAIISRYFVVLPPEKVQEILSMYVEYQLSDTKNK